MHCSHENYKTAKTAKYKGERDSWSLHINSNPAEKIPKNKSMHTYLETILNIVLLESAKWNFLYILEEEKQHLIFRNIIHFSIT